MLLAAATPTSIALALSAGALAVAAAALFVAVARRAAPPAADLLDTIDSLARGLNGAQERSARLSEALAAAQDEAATLRRRLEMATTLDPDAALARTLEAALSLPDVDAASVLVSRAGDEEPLVATLGMSSAEVMGQPLEWPGEGVGARSIVMSFHGPVSPDVENPIRGSIAAPLTGERGPAGTLAVYWRRQHTPSDEQVEFVEELADIAGPVITNAILYREALARAELDPLTDLHNRRYFHEALAREVARTQRYARKLSLIIFDLDDFKAINERLRHLAGDAILAEVGARIRSVVRAADTPCRVGGDEFAIVLAESEPKDARQLYERLAAALAASTGANGLTVSAGIAELRVGDDSRTFFERADAALFRAKRQGKGQVVVDSEGEGASFRDRQAPAGLGGTADRQT